jgi:hypothetical protein
MKNSPKFFVMGVSLLFLVNLLVRSNNLSIAQVPSPAAVYPPLPGNSATGPAVTTPPPANIVTATPPIGAAPAALPVASPSPAIAPAPVSGPLPNAIPVNANPVSSAPTALPPAATPPKGDVNEKVIVEDKIVRPGTGTSLIIQSEIRNRNEEARASIQDYMQFRDPFKSPEIQSSVQGNISQLEKYIITEYKLTGVMTGPLRMRAMIMSPDGKTHFVSEGVKLGNRGGIIKKITTKSVVVRERSVNALGEEEFTTTQILISRDLESPTIGSSSPR